MHHCLTTTSATAIQLIIDYDILNENMQSDFWYVYFENNI